MRNVKKLLVPIDSSPESEKALKYASSLATDINAELIALYVVQDILEEAIIAYTFPPEGYGYFDARPSPRPIDALLRERSCDLWRFIERTVGDQDPAKIKKLVRLGRVREEMAAVARQEQIDLIVVEWRKQFLFSSRTRRRLLKAIGELPYPVLLPPPLGEEPSQRGKGVVGFHPIFPRASTA
jgi:nucleotide-binding universal stress UspA family protein